MRKKIKTKFGLKLKRHLFWFQRGQKKESSLVKTKLLNKIDSSQTKVNQTMLLFLVKQTFLLKNETITRKKHL